MPNEDKDTPPDFFTWESADGETYIVDRWELVPDAARIKARRVAPRPNPHRESTGNDGIHGWDRSSVDGPSFAAGFGLAILFGTLFFLFKLRRSLWMRVMFGVALVAVSAYAYGAWIARASGSSNHGWVTPGQIVRSAHEARRMFEGRQKENERILEDLE